MIDPLSWTIHLGRWAGVQVRIHLVLVVFFVLELLNAALVRENPLGAIAATVAWLALLLVALAVHELGHTLMAFRLGQEPEDIRLGPLGNLVGPLPPSAMRASDAIRIGLAGPLVSLAMALAVAVGLNVLTDTQMVFNPFGNSVGTGGAPLLADGKSAVAPFQLVWFWGWFGYLNWVIFLANLILAYPFDGGRVFRSLLEGPWGGSARDNLLGPWTARVCSLLLFLAGIVLLFKSNPGCWIMFGLAFVVFWTARQEVRMLEEGGFYDDTFLGYDFSQGYTSLEANAATVRPRREGALRRWRRRRSELRRQRQDAREAAELERMDSILDKIYREGSRSLTEEETSFLHRVSTKFKNRSSKSRG